MEDREFREIAHSGGRVTIQVVTREDGQRAYSNGWSHNRPTGAAIYAVHVIQPGIPVGTAVLGGLGSPIDRGPIPGCFMVFVASDSEMMFGQQCPRCSGYWRSRAPSRFCPYCDLHGDNHVFLTDAQGAYIQQYSALMAQALDAPDGEHVIDLDAVADAVSSLEKPPFYYSEERQQNKFTCEECGNVADILGRFGYCSLCGTRNDIQELDKKTLAAIRERINTSGEYESCVRDAVAAFDSLAGVYVRELLRIVPVTKARRNRLSNSRFHNLAQVQAELASTFDIDIFSNLERDDQAFSILMFHRRHVYEHNGGEVDQQYIDQSGDSSVRIKQSLRETQDTAHRIVSAVAKMSKNLHAGFHELCPVEDRFIKLHKRR